MDEFISRKKLSGQGWEWSVFHAKNCNSNRNRLSSRSEKSQSSRESPFASQDVGDCHSSSEAFSFTKSGVAKIRSPSALLENWTFLLHAPYQRFEERTEQEFLFGKESMTVLPPKDTRMYEVMFQKVQLGTSRIIFWRMQCRIDATNKNSPKLTRNVKEESVNLNAAENRRVNIQNNDFSYRNNYITRFESHSLFS